MKKDDKSQEPNHVQYMPIGMCIGIGVGMAIGAAFGSIAIGMCIGLSIGMCIGVAVDSMNKEKTDDASQGEETEQEERDK